MEIELKYLLLFVFLPAVGLSQTRYVNHKKIVAGGTRFDIHDQGYTFGTNPVFLVPMDTLGNVSLTAAINNIRVIGKFAPFLYTTDTIMADDPLTGGGVLKCDSNYNVRKQGEWGYYSVDGLKYYEFYDKGELIRIDSLEGYFTLNERKIKIVDSMARIRSILDIYIKKGRN